MDPKINIKIVQAYQTKDGRLFKTLRNAALHHAKYEIIEEAQQQYRDGYNQEYFRSDKIGEGRIEYEYLHIITNYTGECKHTLEQWRKYPQIENYHNKKQTRANKIIDLWKKQRRLDKEL